MTFAVLPRPARLWAALLVLATLWIARNSADGYQQQCDPAVTPYAESEYAYRWRQNRCEGLYRRPVASDGLWVASLTLGRRAGQWTNAPVSIRWKAPSDKRVRLRASALRKDFFYRMDFESPTPGSGKFEWPGEVRNGLNLQPPDVVLTGQFVATLAGREQTVHVPLDIGIAAAGATPVATLVPLLTLDSILQEVYRLDAEGKPEVRVTPLTPLPGSFFPAQVPVELEVGALGPSTGAYYRLALTLVSEGDRRRLVHAWLHW